MIGPISERMHYVELVEHHEISVPTPRDVSRARKEELWLQCSESAHDWAEEQGLTIDPHHFETFEDAETEAALGVQWHVVVGRGFVEDGRENIVWSARWRRWLAILSSVALRERSASLDAALARGAAVSTEGLANLIDLDSHR